MPLKAEIGTQFWKELLLLCRLKLQRKLQNSVRRALTTIPALIEIESSGTIVSLSPTESAEGRQSNRRQLVQTIQGISLAGKSNDKSSTQKVTKAGQILSEKSCQNCGEKFYYKNSKAKFCTTACRRAAWERKKAKLSSR